MAQEWRELLEKRTRTSKSKRLHIDGQPTHKFSWDGNLGLSMHYLDAQSTWQDVDESVEEPDGAEGFTLKFTKLSYFGRVDGEGRRRFYPDRNDLSYWIEFKKPYANMGIPTRHNRWFYWDFAHAVIGIRFDVDSLKFGFRLKNNQAPTSITIPFETQGITRQGRLLLHDGEVVAKLRKPIAYGSNLDEEGMPVQKDCNVVFGPGEVTISVDPTGLDYPIEIDPTIDKQVAAGGDDGYCDNGTFRATQTYMYAGTSSRRLFARWTDVTYEGIVDVSYIELYINYVLGSPELKVYGVDEDNPDAPANCTEMDNDPLTDAAVDWDTIDTTSAWEQSPSLNTIFQELVDTYTISGDAVMVQVKDDKGGGSHFFGANTYETAPTGTLSAKLHIEYTTGGAPQTISDAGNIASGLAFGAALLILSILPGSIASGEAFGSATVQPDAVTLQPAAIVSQEAFGSTTVSAGAITLLPSGITSQEAFGTPLLALTIEPTGIASSEAFGQASLALAIEPSGIATGEVFGTPSVKMKLEPGGIGSAETFGTAILVLTIEATGVGSEQIFGAAKFILYLKPAGIAGEEAFGTPTMLGDQVVQPPGTASQEGFGQSTVSGGVEEDGWTGRGIRIQAGALTKVCEMPECRMRKGAAIPVVIVERKGRSLMAGHAIPVRRVEVGTRPLRGGAALRVVLCDPEDEKVVGEPAMPIMVISEE